MATLQDREIAKSTQKAQPRGGLQQVGVLAVLAGMGTVLAFVVILARQAREWIEYQAIDSLIRTGGGAAVTEKEEKVAAEEPLAVAP